MIENKRVKNRRDIAANWTANNPVLLAGEFGIELDSTPIKMKIGDGATHWNDLPYAGASESEIIEIIEETTYTKQQIDTALDGKADADDVYTKAEVDNIKSEIEGEIPTVNDSTVNIYQGGTLKGSFTLNQSSGETINLDAGGVSSVDWDDITDKPDFSTVAISGEYNDLLHRPDIPVNTSDLTNDSGFITINDVPAQVNADWNSNSGVSQILNKPTVYNEWFGTQQEYDAIVIKDPDTVYHIAGGGGGVQVQADWTETQVSSPAYIRHKPTIPTATSDLTNDSGFVTSSDVPTATSDLTNDSGFITINDVPAQVNADWNSNSGASQILNKPTIPTATSDLTNDSGFITLSDVPAQAQADWTEADTTSPSYIQHKPTIPTVTSDLTNDSGFITINDVPAQVNSDWNANSGVAQILNKPTIPTATSDLTNDSGFITISDVPAQVQSDWTEADSSDPSYIQNKPMVYTEWFGTQQEYDAILEKDSNTIYHIEGPAPAQSDWNEVNSSSMAFILNKPTIPTATSDLTNDSGFITISDVPAQVNSDWNAVSGVSQILNKPSMTTETLTFTLQGGTTQTITVYIQPTI